MVWRIGTMYRTHCSQESSYLEMRCVLIERKGRNHWSCFIYFIFFLLWLHCYSFRMNFGWLPSLKDLSAFNNALSICQCGTWPSRSLLGQSFWSRLNKQEMGMMGMNFSLGYRRRHLGGYEILFGTEIGNWDSLKGWLNWVGLNLNNHHIKTTSKINFHHSMWVNVYWTHTHTHMGERGREIDRQADRHRDCFFWSPQLWCQGGSRASEDRWGITGGSATEHKLKGSIGACLPFWPHSMCSVISVSFNVSCIS